MLPMNKFGIGGFEPRPRASSGARSVKALFAVVGFVGGIAAAIYTYLTGPSSSSYS
jgi:hypothetical protein